MALMIPCGCSSKARLAVLHEATRARRVGKSGQFSINMSRISTCSMIRDRTLVLGSSSFAVVDEGSTASEARSATSDRFGQIGVPLVETAKKSPVACVGWIE